MPFGTYDAPKIDKKPTFLQYLKLKGKGVSTKTQHTILFVWLPGQFDNVTIETELFRYVAPKGNPVYDDFVKYFEEYVSGDEVSSLQLRIDSVVDKRIEVSLEVKKSGDWKTVSETGRKWNGY